jgi:lycopene beta-cyclase
MTYRGFHYRINVPLLAILFGCLGLVGFPFQTLWPTVLALGLLLAVVVVFTSPWDNTAIEWGIWNFPDDRLLFRIRLLPIEELLFFIVQTVEVVLCVLICLVLFDIRLSPAVVTHGNLIACGLIALVWGVVLVLGRRIPVNHKRWHYAWHLGVWFLPLIAMQWALAPSVLLAGFSAIIVSTITIGTVLSVADVWAVRRGIWFFDPGRNTGHLLAGILPWEEVAFFFITSIVVSQSILLLLPPR